MISSAKSCFVISGVFKRDRTNFIYCKAGNFINKIQIVFCLFLIYILKTVASVASKLIFNHIEFRVLSDSLHCFSFCYEN